MNILMLYSEHKHVPRGIMTLGEARESTNLVIFPWGRIFFHVVNKNSTQQLMGMEFHTIIRDPRVYPDFELMSFLRSRVR
jgi:hypothetical protein